MEKKKYYIIGIISLLLILAFIFSPSGEDIKSYQLNKSDFKETLSASGRVEAKNRINMSFQKSGIIEEIYAIEGQSYEKGAPLIALEKVEEENEIDGKRLQLKSAQNNLKEVENQYKIKALNNEVSKTNYENIKLLYERNLRLLEAGGVSQKDVEDIKLQLKEAEAKKTLNELEYRSYAPGGFSREKVILEIENSKNQLEKAEFEKNKKIIFAPFPGQVLNISKEKFSNVQMGETGIVFAEDKSFIVTDVDERDYQKVKVGQKAFIQFLGSGDIKEGTVRDVSPFIDRTKGTIGIRIDLNEETALKTDIGVNVEIIVNEYKDKLIVPSEFVFSNPTRIIFLENEKSKVVLIKSYEKAEGYFILLDSELDQYMGKSIISKDLKDGEKIK